MTRSAGKDLEENLDGSASGSSIELAGLLDLGFNWVECWIIYLFTKVLPCQFQLTTYSVVLWYLNPMSIVTISYIYTVIKYYKLENLEEKLKELDILLIINEH